MKINISYGESLSFDEFKEKFEQYFLSMSPKKKGTEMKAAWEKAEAAIKSKEENELAVSSGGESTKIDIDYANGDKPTEGFPKKGKKPFTSETSTGEPIT